MPTISARIPDHHPVFERRKAVLSGEVDAPATVALAVLLKHFGSTEWFDWEPDVLYQEVLDDFNVKMPPGVRDKLWALVTALTTDLFYRDPLFMNHVANALGDGPTNMAMFEPATLEEIAWAVIEVGMNDLDDSDEENFAPEIQIYVGALLKREGLGPIPPLEWAQTEAPGLAVDDPSVAAMQTQERAEKMEILREHLKEQVQRLHEELRRCDAAPAGR
jgi:acyl carrier protein phosphodiesterase